MHLHSHSFIKRVPAQGSASKLKQALLKRDPRTQLLKINFDPTLVCLLREVKYFLLLDLDVPESALGSPFKIRFSDQGRPTPAQTPPFSSRAWCCAFLAASILRCASGSAAPPVVALLPPVSTSVFVKDVGDDDARLPPF